MGDVLYKKRVVKHEIRRANEGGVEVLASDFKERKNMFWKEVKGVCMGDSKKEECVKDVDGGCLWRGSKCWEGGGSIFESL